MSRDFQVTFDAEDPAALLGFWCEVLGYRPEPLPEQTRAGLVAAGIDPATSGRLFAAALDPDGVRPRLLALRVPEGKTAKNRLHLDVRVSGPAAIGPEVERLVALGARHVADFCEHGSTWAVLTDPEGNEFCVTG